ncbi:hypothetical protein Poli38472_014024 [Pythium oligandrum]|uniref:START domain-containing protein n=1 Tax=Pythium oligandrum TaxID=41045 RepID=A0A8K1CNB0_PYTOL|nr:hypothetical protein Poli38472_014024 [Pythium oligandrum]|eukprot:TMW66712.1 hypothetical protein Poli38472_014024 [Pythium oligandrum]
MAVRPEDLLLDGDRLHMLLDVICTDYITASYASRENGKKVVIKALQKLSLSVYAGTAHCHVTKVKDAPFLERCKVFYEELMSELEQARQQRLLEREENAAYAETMPQLPLADDSIVKEVLKPKLLQFVEESCKERDRSVRSVSVDQGIASRTPQAGGVVTAPRSASIPAPVSATPGSSTNLLGGTMPAQSMAPNVPIWQAGEIRMEGWLRKKGQHVNLWRDRYFMIRSTPQGTHCLCYFRRKGEKEPRDWYILGPGTVVDEVRESPSKIETKPLFTFRIHPKTYGGEEVDEAPANTPHEAPAALLTPSRSTTASFDMPLSPEGSNGDHDYDPRSAKKASSRKFRNRAAAAAAAATAATAVVLTGGLAGVGMGMVGMGMSAAAAASAGAGAAIIVQNRNKGPIALAAESLETAMWWRNSIVECVAQAEEQWKRYLNWYMDKDHELQQSEDGSFGDLPPASINTSHLSGRPPLSQTASSAPSKSNINRTTSTRPRAGSFGAVPRSIAKTFRTSATFSQETSWKLYSFSTNLRVDVERSQLHMTKTGPPPALRTSIKVKASAKQVFERIMKMESSFYSLNHVIQEARVIEDHPQDHSDVVYWRLAPTFLWPVYVEARDLCLLRYWRMEQDSSYFICFQSTTHNDCPNASTTKAVRGSVLGGGFIISPRVEADENFEECWVTLTIQIDPKGWLDSSLTRSWYYLHAYGVYVLEMITTLTAPPHADTTPRPYLPPQGSVSGGSSASSPIKSPSPASTNDLRANQIIVSDVHYPRLEPFRTDLAIKHSLPPKFWSEPDATSFLVRGPHYLSTHTKVRSAPQPFRLVSVELLKSTEKIRHIGLSSFEGPGLSCVTSDGQPPFIFIINFIIPGPPEYSVVFYFTPEHPTELKKNSVFADLCHELMHGESDTFRSKRLKLIPRIVQGTWPIREGIGTTPAILGTKVNHEYHRGTQYLEVDYDISSSVVASAVVKMVLGYTRDIILDLAFVIEAQSTMELPERVLGCVRLDCVDTLNAVQYAAKKPVKAKDTRQE